MKLGLSVDVYQLYTVPKFKPNLTFECCGTLSQSCEVIVCVICALSWW